MMLVYLYLPLYRLSGYTFISLTLNKEITFVSIVEINNFIFKSSLRCLCILCRNTVTFVSLNGWFCRLKDDAKLKLNMALDKRYFKQWPTPDRVACAYSLNFHLRNWSVCCVWCTQFYVLGCSLLYDCSTLTHHPRRTFFNLYIGTKRIKILSEIKFVHFMLSSKPTPLRFYQQVSR
jgi:hypothetical protein